MLHGSRVVRGIGFGLLILAWTATLPAQTPAPPAPVPQPFPRPGGQAGSPPRTGGQQQPPPPAAAPAETRPAPASSSLAAPSGPDGVETPPTEATLGLPIYPGSQFIASYDAGRGQRYYIFGSTASFVDLVAYYRNVLKQRGEPVFDAPATYMFEVGKYREETMAFPPGVTVKDFQSEVSEGYPNPKPGGQPTHFRTIVQFVPVTER